MVGGVDHGKKIHVAIERGSDGEPVWSNLPQEYNTFMAGYSDHD